MASLASYLVTCQFIEEFEFAIAQELVLPEDKRGPEKVWNAIIEGHRSVLTELYAEAKEFEDKHIRVHENEDDQYFAALIDTMQEVTGIGATREKALIDLRLKIDKAFS